LNLKTMEKIMFDTKISSLNKPIASADGYEYSKVRFNASLDESKLSPGEYALFTKIINGDISKESEFRNYYTEDKPDDKTVGDFTYRYLINTGYSYRYELRIDNAKIDYSVVRKPTSIASNFDFNEIVLDQSILKIDAFAWIYGVDINEDTNNKYKLLLIDENGTVIEKELSNQACKFDLSAIYKLKFDTKLSCINQSVNLADLQEGNYRILLDMNVNNYRDIIELYDHYGRLGISSQINNKIYQLTTSPVRNRFNLSITLK